ncbi:MAG: glycosyltransferase family 39 protein [Alphaproteobacteria bacterium]
MTGAVTSGFDRASAALLRARADGAAQFGPWTTGAVIAFAVIAGAWARLSTVGHDALFMDELYSWAVTKMSAWHILTTPFDVHPPLFFLVEKAFAAFGDSETALRAPSVIAGIATAALVFQFARKYCGTTASAFGAVVLLLSYKHIVHSSTARNYALLLLLAFAATWVLVLLARRLTTGDQPTRKIAPLFAAYSVLALGTIMTHVVGSVYILVLNGLVLLGFGLERPDRSFRLGTYLAALNLVPYCIFAVWFFRAQSTSTDYGWLQGFSVVDAAKIFVVTFGPDRIPIGGGVAEAILVLVALLVLAGVIVAIARTPVDYWAPTIAMTIALPIALYALTPVQAVYMERTILFTVPGAALAISALVGWLRWKAASLVIGGALAVAYLSSAISYVTRDSKIMAYGMQPIQDFRGAMKQVNTEVAQGAGLLTCETFTEPALRYYGEPKLYENITTTSSSDFGVRSGKWIDYFGLPAVKRDEGKWIQDKSATPDRYQRLVYLDVATFCLQQDSAIFEALQGRGFTIDGVTRFQGINVYSLTRR